MQALHNYAIRFLVPHEVHTPEDGESEHEGGTPLFKTKLTIQTADAKHGVIVTSSTVIDDRDMLIRIDGASGSAPSNRYL